MHLIHILVARGMRDVRVWDLGAKICKGARGVVRAGGQGGVSICKSDAGWLRVHFWALGSGKSINEYVR